MTTAELLDLLGIWEKEAVQSQLRSSCRNFNTYGQISCGLCEKGYDWDTVQCIAKIKELSQAYQKAREANLHSAAAPKSCRFNKELDAILCNDPTSTSKRPMDTLVGLETEDSGPNPEDEVVDKEMELEDVVEPTAGWSGTTWVRNSPTPEGCSQSQHSVSGKHDAGAETLVFSNNDEALINKKLPKELLLRIFSFLDIVTLCRCAQVSKAWNVLALDGSNWQRIDLFNFQTDIEGRVVENISKRCGGFLRQLSLRGCLGVGDSALKTFAQNCRNIEHLNLNGCTKITDSEGCRNLEHLNLSWCDQITKDGIEALVKGCSGLKALFLRGCTQLEDEALKHIQNHCRELIILNLQSCTQISDEGIVKICRGCHRLQSLCISGCSNLTDASLTALGLNCPRLKILEAARCSHLTDAGFTLLARNCHELEKMDLEECILITDNTLIQLSVHCPKLQALSLSHCELITDDGILHLSNSTCGHERLQVLELDNCLLITDVTLEHLENCHSLERIELYDCQQVTRAGIKRIRAHLPDVKVHAYFAPVTPPPSVGGSRQRLCRCCIIL
ncbi:F-box/LRR-repeat protein 2 isoform X2 [Lepidochelys kempii]|uniref:F-box/LRR-repeat protein 2 isoform X2 n=1 Tax=Lepidochelys kempii TaxID=8472 RepID=UPI003C704474